MNGRRRRRRRESSSVCRSDGNRLWLSSLSLILDRRTL
jgi:hypothetical protein